MAVHGILHSGSGLGNQLFRYVATRALAEEKGFEWGMVAPENFKGNSFMSLDMGVSFPGTYTTGAGGEVIPISSMASFAEKKVVENCVDIRGYDPEYNFIADNTVIDGEFQDIRYWGHRIPDFTDWFNVDYLPMPHNTCVISFRGGEYQAVPDLYLTKEYWIEAMEQIRQKRPDTKFIAVTDDVAAARAMLPESVKVYHDIGMDWRMIRNAGALILSNSSFCILPALMNTHAHTILAPRYWARRNTKVWALPQNYYSKFTYI